MEWKLNDWDEKLHKGTCPQYGGELENKKRHRQIVTYVSDVDCDRYKSYCHNCKKTEYPLCWDCAHIKAQGDYFQSMEVYENPSQLIYADMDGVMINKGQLNRYY